MHFCFCCCYYTNNLFIVEKLKIRSNGEMSIAFNRTPRENQRDAFGI